MKSLKTLAIAVLRELGARCCASGIERDVKTILSRCEHEGDSFLEITLPLLGKAFDRALDQGRWDPCAPGLSAFKRARGSVLPAFLTGFTGSVFNEIDGWLLATPDIEAIRSVRQICLMFGKIFELCPSKYEVKSIREYEDCEQFLGELIYDEELLSALGDTASNVFGGKFQSIEDGLRRHRLVPRHGPGATSDRLVGNEKFDSSYWTRRLEAVFPSASYLVANDRWWRQLQHVEIVPPGAETPVRVITVPKTAVKARVIAMEPTNVQYVQQALLREFTRLFSGNSPFVALDNQDRNRMLAQAGSKTGRLATLDLSEASDRVTVRVVSAVFRDYPLLLRALLASRSMTARLPSGKVIPLRKFASMGSATCFPVEAIVFATVALNSYRKWLGHSQLTQSDLRRAREHISVFGDDIIIPSETVHCVASDLASIGAKVNADKSFWTGRFRESCGGDYYDGEDVTVTRLRRRLPSSHHDASEVLGLASFRNQCYYAGLWKVCQLLDVWISSIGPWPNVEPTSPVVGRVSVLGHEVQRYHPDLQIPLVKGWKVRTASPYSESSGYGKLLKCLLPERCEPFQDPRHLTRSGRADSVSINVGWGPAY